MPLSPPIAWDTLENAVRRWFSRATGLVTIWASEDAPQPPYPFAVLKLISGPVQSGRDDERHTTITGAPIGEEILIEVCGPRDVTVSCQVYSASDRPKLNAQHYIGIAQASLGLPSILDAFRVERIAFVDSSPPQDLDFIASGGTKSRAVMDVRFRIESSMTERTGYIATVGATGTFTNPDGTTVVVDANFGATP